jgi:uncharacterized protein YkwD
VLHSRMTMLLVLLIALTAGPVGSTFSASEGSVDPANDHFAETWERSDLPVREDEVDRTWMWGPSPNTDGVKERYDDAPGGERVVQYFDKTRMEINNPDGDPTDPWFVTNGLLARDLMTGRVQVGHNSFEYHSPSEIPVAGDYDDPTGPTYASMNAVRGEPARPQGEVIVEEVDRSGNVTRNDAYGEYGITDARYVPQTNHNVASVFWDFMTSAGTIAAGGEFIDGNLFPDPFYATGFPLTEAYWTTVQVDGEPKNVLLQVFQRRVLTYTPGNPDGWRVEAGNVGLHYYQWVYDVLDEEPQGNSPADAARCLDDEESEFLNLINDYRQANGLDTLENSEALNVASYGHSVDMGERGYFAHVSPDGEQPPERMAAAGYDYNVHRGENLAAGFWTAEDVLDGWINSPGHNEMMLNPDMNVIGIGRVEMPGSEWGVYWTTKFGGYVDSAPEC